MRRAAFFISAGVVLGAMLWNLSGRSARSTPESGHLLRFEQTNFDAGRIGQTEPNVVRHTFRFRNESPHRVAIRRVQSTCGCTVADGYKAEYQPGEAGELTLTLTLPEVGRQSGEVYVFPEGAASPIVLRISGERDVPCLVNCVPVKLAFRSGAVAPAPLRLEILTNKPLDVTFAGAASRSQLNVQVSSIHRSKHRTGTGLYRTTMLLSVTPGKPRDGDSDSLELTFEPASVPPARIPVQYE